MSDVASAGKERVVTPRRPRWTNRWTARLMIVAATGVLLWHVLACVESPMAFSPNGDLAFTTITPHPILSSQENGQDGDFLLAVRDVSADARAPR